MHGKKGRDQYHAKGWRFSLPVLLPGISKPLPFIHSMHWHINESAGEWCKRVCTAPGIYKVCEAIRCIFLTVDKWMCCNSSNKG